MGFVETPIDSFMAHCLMERGFAANSLRNYRAVLTGAQQWLAVQHESSLLSASAEQFGGYLAGMTRRGCQSSTCRMAWNALQSFLGFCGEMGHDRRLVQANFDPPTLGKPLPVVLNRYEVDRLLRAPAKYDRTFLRDRAVLETLYACGLRISELTGLRISDLDLKDRHIRVLGKGGKERVIPLGRMALAAIELYLRDMRPKLVKDATDKLWLTLRGKPMGKNCVRKLIAECRDRANIIPRVVPHTLRHCFATHLVAGGANLRVVQELMGHAKLTTTEVYLHLDPTRLKAVHKKFHPRG